MNKIGRLLTEGTCADVFEDVEGFHYFANSWGIDENGDEFTKSERSATFPSLQMLIASLPPGILYLPNGQSKPDPAYMQQLYKKFDESFERLQKVYEQRRKNAE